MTTKHTWSLCRYACMVLTSYFALHGDQLGLAQDQTVRFATFNVSFYGKAPGELRSRTKAKSDTQLQAVAEIIQRVRPDVLLLNEVDYDASGEILDNFLSNYLATGQNVSQSAAGASLPIDFEYRFVAPSNTGIHSGEDLDRNGQVTSKIGSVEYGGDCWGYGEYPGKYAMVLLSRYPIEVPGVRTFKNFLWRDMPAAMLPDDAANSAAADWYSQEILTRFPLSSKSHWDVPVKIRDRTIHMLCSHPTPPTYDGVEDRNGRRNHDEIRFWVDYIAPGKSGYIYDDDGGRGGLKADADFVIVGDLNGDPIDGQGKQGIAALLSSDRVNTSLEPSSEGGLQQSKLQGGANLRHEGDSRCDTLDASDSDGPGNLRVDYVIPSSGIQPTSAGVFWPLESEPHFGLVGTHPFPSSDHRLVWLDAEIDPTENSVRD